MRRREFMAVLGGAAMAWPLAARAQQPERMRRIGFISLVPENDPEARARIRAFQQGLAALDWVEGRNILIDYRFAAAGDAARIHSNVAELLNSPPDVIVANGTPVVAALKQATATIPIVFAIINDPVGQGFITSLARPGGNITGFTLVDFELVGKWLEMLREMAPDVRRAALMFNPETAPFYKVFLRQFGAAPAILGTEIAALVQLGDPRRRPPGVPRCGDRCPHRRPGRYRPRHRRMLSTSGTRRWFPRRSSPRSDSLVLSSRASASTHGSWTIRSV